MKRNNQFYPDDFKQIVVKEVLDGIISKDEARRRFGILGKSTVLKWIRKFETSQSNLKVNTEKNPTTMRLQELEAENKRLLAELQIEQLRNRALNVMIDLAEEKLKIPIRKKSGAKQLKK